MERERGRRFVGRCAFRRMRPHAKPSVRRTPSTDAAHQRRACRAHRCMGAQQRAADLHPTIGRPPQRPDTSRMSTPQGSKEHVIRVVDSPAQLDAEDWNALLEAQAAPTPFMRHEYLLALHESGSAVARVRLGPAAACLHEGDVLVGCLPGLPEEPLLRRVRLRLGLGRCLPAPRPALLPEAAVRRAVHARARQPTAGARCRQRAGCCCARCGRSARAASCRRRTCCSWTRPTCRPPQTKAGCCARRCSSTGSTANLPGTRASTTSWPACSATSARRSLRSDAGWPRPASSSVHTRARRSTPACGTSSTTATRAPTPRTTRRPT